MKKIQILLVGLGRIGQSLEDDPFRRKPCTHAGTVLSPQFKNKLTLSGVMDSNPSQLKDFFLRFNQRNRKNVKEFISFPSKAQDFGNIDLVVIATPSKSHSKLVEQFIKSGIKNILVEKPLALNSNDGNKLLKLSKKNKVNIWVNHERRYHPVYNYFRNELIQGSFGRILRIQASVLTSAMDPGHGFSRDSIGPLYHDGTHAVDFIQWLLGDPIRINSKLTKSNPRLKVEDRVIAWMEYKNDVEVFLEVGGFRKYFQYEIDIQTDESRIVLSNDGFLFWKSKESKLYKGFRSLTKTRLPIPKKILKNTNPFPILYNSIYTSIVNNQPPETGGIEDNISILKILQRINKN